jgi:hypothetical protein
MMSDVLREYKDRRSLQEAASVGRAQQIFLQYYTRCFWHLRKDLTITPELLPLVQQGLRKHGGREGMLLASEISPLPRQ